VDARFILAVTIQESAACVRAPTTAYGHRNPGLMQSHNGRGTCNEGEEVLNPCPAETILTMIRDGAAGTVHGDGLVQLLRQTPLQTDMKYYQAARMYNSGSIDPSGELERGIATHCYASDIANRLTGWVHASTKCYFDRKDLPLSTTPKEPPYGGNNGIPTGTPTPWIDGIPSWESPRIPSSASTSRPVPSKPKQ
jgi:hypothetical protein